MRDRSWEHAVRAMQVLAVNIENDDSLTVASVAEAVGIAQSTLYRWLETPPDKIDVAAIASVADYLHDVHGHESFLTLWRRTAE